MKVLKCCFGGFNFKNGHTLGFRTSRLEHYISLTQRYTKQIMSPFLLQVAEVLVAFLVRLKLAQAKENFRR